MGAWIAGESGGQVEEGPPAHSGSEARDLVPDEEMKRHPPTPPHHGAEEPNGPVRPPEGVPLPGLEEPLLHEEDADERRTDSR